MKKLFLILIILMQCKDLYSGSAGSDANYESRYIVDMPTAGVIPSSHFSFTGRLFNNGGTLGEFTVSPLTNLELGLSFGGTNIIGSGDIVWQDIPGFSARYRVIDEEEKFPAITIGFNTQGRGFYDKAENRFQTLSPGIFISASKSFKWALGPVAGHFGINYSFEQNSANRSPNFYIGIEQAVSFLCSLNLEFNSNMDDSGSPFMYNQGLMNITLRIPASHDFTIELTVRDLFGNLKNTDGFSRVAGVEFISSF